MIQVASLVAAGIGPTQARLFEAPLLAACARFGIDTPLRQAAFVAQCAHESRLFTALEEGLWYRSAERIRAIFRGSVPTLAIAQRLVGNPKALADHVYANRNGNRDEASGDGWRYRGRGLIQLTGRTNYTRAAAELARPYVDQPDLVLEPADACLTAAWFWNAGKLNALADASRIDDITRAINGTAMAGADERRRLFEATLAAFAPPAAASRGRARSAPSTGTRRRVATPAAAEPKATSTKRARAKATRAKSTDANAMRTKTTKTTGTRSGSTPNGTPNAVRAATVPAAKSGARIPKPRNAAPRHRPRG
jgi:putative chitinase